MARKLYYVVNLSRHISCLALYRLRVRVLLPRACFARLQTTLTLPACERGPASWQDKMPLLSIAVKFENGAFIRPFGLVTVENGWTLMKLYDNLTKGLLNTGDNFVLEPKYRDYPVSVSVSDSSSGSSQSCPMTSCVLEVREFGKCVTFKLESAKPVFTGSQLGPPNVFDLYV